jgi:putative Mn2+ efflux pump MntP
VALSPETKRLAGMALTALGVLLLAYAIVTGLAKGQIGTKEAAITPDIAAFIVGWFAVLIGPALWLGETPAVIRKAARRG